MQRICVKCASIVSLQYSLIHGCLIAGIIQVQSALPKGCIALVLFQLLCTASTLPYLLRCIALLPLHTAGTSQDSPFFYARLFCLLTFSHCVASLNHITNPTAVLACRHCSYQPKLCMLLCAPFLLVC
jgi:hypothetical protein